MSPQGLGEVAPLLLELLKARGFSADMVRSGWNMQVVIKRGNEGMMILGVRVRAPAIEAYRWGGAGQAGVFDNAGKRMRRDTGAPDVSAQQYPAFMGDTQAVRVQIGAGVPKLNHVTSTLSGGLGTSLTKSAPSDAAALAEVTKGIFGKFGVPPEKMLVGDAVAIWYTGERSKVSPYRVQLVRNGKTRVDAARLPGSDPAEFLSVIEHPEQNYGSWLTGTFEPKASPQEPVVKAVIATPRPPPTPALTPQATPVTPTSSVNVAAPSHPVQQYKPAATRMAGASPHSWQFPDVSAAEVKTITLSGSFADIKRTVEKQLSPAAAGYFLDLVRGQVDEIRVREALVSNRKISVPFDGTLKVVGDGLAFEFDTYEKPKSDKDIPEGFAFTAYAVNRDGTREYFDFTPSLLVRVTVDGKRNDDGSAYYGGIPTAQRNAFKTYVHEVNKKLPP